MLTQQQHQSRLLMRAVGLALLVCVVTRAPAFRYRAISDDEAIYHTMAREIADGGVMYRDVVDHKPPGLSYTYAALVATAGDSHSWFVVHLFGLLAVAGTCLALAGISRRMLEPSLALWPPLLYALASAALQPVDALVLNGELLMNLPTAVAVWLALSRGPNLRGSLSDLAAGVCIGLATLTKYQAGVVLVAMLMLVDGRTWWRPLLWGLGAGLPVAAFAAWFTHRGILSEAAFWGLFFNQHYLAEGPLLLFSLKRLALQGLGVILPSGLLYGCSALALMRLIRRPWPEVREGRWFLLAWTAGALFCVGLGGRFFGHYFLQLELPLALVAPMVLAPLWQKGPRMVGAALAIPALLFSVLAAKPSWARACFDADSPDYDTIGRAIAAQTEAGDRIWVWGNAPALYPAADRRTGARFTFCNYLTGLSPATPSEYDPDVDPSRGVVPEAMDMALADLERLKPRLIVDTAAAGLKGYGKFPIARYPKLAHYLQIHYHRDGEAAGIPIYVRNPR
jgi:hypothetical protein